MFLVILAICCIGFEDYRVTGETYNERLAVCLLPIRMTKLR